MQTRMGNLQLSSVLALPAFGKQRKATTHVPSFGNRFYRVKANVSDWASKIENQWLMGSSAILLPFAFLAFTKPATPTADTNLETIQTRRVVNPKGHKKGVYMLRTQVDCETGDVENQLFNILGKPVGDPTPVPPANKAPATDKAQEDKGNDGELPANASKASADSHTGQNIDLSV